MLTSITSYLFGGQAETEAEATTEQPRLKTRSAESDDWVLVDKASRDSSVDPTSCLARLGEATAAAAATPSRVPAIHPSSESPLVFKQASSNSVSPDASGSDSGSDIVTLSPRRHRALDESWLVTPPPCFTAGGSSPHHMEESPLENLLIEHPSMSVYGPRGRPGSTGLESQHSESSADEDMGEKSSPPQGSTSTTTRVPSLRHPPRRPRALAARAGLDACVKSARGGQVVQQRYCMRRNTRNSLSRQNKVSQHVSKSRRARHRTGQLQQPHCKSNNRRC